jgi:hypothetical protein
LFETLGDKLVVFVEPETQEEGEGQRRIVQMVVKSTSYIDGDLTDSESAVAKSGLCTCYSTGTLPRRSAYLHAGDLHWSIGHTALSQEKKEHELSKARERQWRAYYLPPGVSVKEMEGIWNDLAFGSRRRQEEASEGGSECGSPSSGPLVLLEEKQSKFDPSLFCQPSRAVKSLRKLSVQGKVDMELMLKEAKGRPKLIWGEPEAYMDQVGSDGVPSGTEVIEALKAAVESLATSEEAVIIDEDIRTEEATAPLAGL